MSKHAFLAPSAASRWLACPASASLSDGVRDAPNIHSATGTVAHWVAEKLLADLDIDILIGTKIDEVTIDLEMIDYVKKYVATVKDYAWDNPILVEQRLPLTTVTGETGERAYGTADALVFNGT